MFTYTITIAPNGRFLFRIEGIDGHEEMVKIAADMTKLYGMVAVHVAKWSKPVGEQINIADIVASPNEDTDHDVVKVERIDSRRRLFWFREGSGVMVNNENIIIASLTGNGVQVWQQGAIEAWVNSEV